jgi:hypothetical protein
MLRKARFAVKRTTAEFTRLAASSTGEFASLHRSA